MNNENFFSLERNKCSNILWKQEQIDFVLDLYFNKKCKMKEITKLFNTSNQSILTLIKKSGKTPRTLLEQNNLHAYKKDEKFFDVIDTEEKAYWLGFLYADGYVSVKKGELRINLQLRDKNHLEKFKKSLKCNVPIKNTNKIDMNTRKNYKLVFINVANIHLIKSLIEKGCVPNKSLILKFPSVNIVPENLIYHFIRGYFDGDGSINISRIDKKSKHPYYSISFVGTYDFLNKIKEYLFCEHLKLESHNNNTYYSLKINGNLQILDLLENYIYKDSNIYLERKYLKFKELQEYYK
jgi:predicted DNA-binding protein YlxM (UPF0122 family)